jgi:hypothetical protein
MQTSVAKIVVVVEVANVVRVAVAAVVVIINCKIVHFVDRTSRYNSLLMTNLTDFFIYLFITALYVFQASQCSSSGDRIVLIHHLV